MSRVLVIGGSGMLGHKLCQLLPELDLQVTATVRRSAGFTAQFPAVFGRTQVLAEVDVLDEERLAQVIGEAQPNSVVNCAGIVKQLAAAHDPLLSVGVNAYLPHKLASLCASRGCRLIHISSDCVFAGTRGMYRETDPSDALDLYGKSKYLGETTPAETGAVTLRTSIIGRELELPGHGLLEWFLAQQGQQVRGFARAIFSGLTTQELARVIGRIIIERPQRAGVYHVASQPISKFDLLSMVRQAYDLSIEIERDEREICDRSLRMDRFHEAVGYTAPSWSEMIADMRRDATPYADFHRNTRK
jgi:dTDP-4-dehydrorhamnose reductase